MKVSLILGSNAGQADIIRYLKNNYWIVHACGHEKKGLGTEICDSFHLVDIKDEAAVTELTKRVKPDILFSISSDIGIRVATKVSERLNLPYFFNSNVVDLFHFKQNLRDFLNSNNLSPVDYEMVGKVEETDRWNQFPCIVKPADSQGQRGITLVKSSNELPNAIRKAKIYSKNSLAIIEEYLEGAEMSTNVIVQNHDIIVNEFTERLVHPLPYFGLPYGHAIPVRNISQCNLNKASKIVEKLVDKLNLKNGVLYIQFKVTGKGPKIIEVAPRLDGCHIWRLIKYARGYDLRKYTIDLLTGSEIEHKIKPNITEPYLLKFHQLKPGVKFSKKKLCEPKGLLFNEYRYHENEKVKEVNGKLEVVGYYLKKE